LCYEETAEKGVYTPIARPVIAAELAETLSYPSLGGKERTASPGDYLLAWGTAYAGQNDLWSLDAQVFARRYMQVEVGADAAPKKTEDAAAGAGGELQFGVASLQGKRDENEDAHLAVVNWKDGVSLFGVFDGHGGDECSAYCAKKLPKLLSWDKEAAQESFQTAFLEVDKKYIDKANDDGSTGCVALVDKEAGAVWVANVGDSRGLIIRDGKAIVLSTDHKPSLPKERERLENGGYEISVDTLVQHGKRLKVPRIDGQLAVSRAFGDDTWKDMDEDPEDWGVSVVPEVQSEQLVAGDICLLACDGLFDVLENDYVAKWVSERIDGADDLDQLAEELAEHAIANKSDDNVSVIIVKL
jgi:serine/threonine protein phosphatase PrpC